MRLADVLGNTFDATINPTNTNTAAVQAFPVPGGGGSVNGEVKGESEKWPMVSLTMTTALKWATRAGLRVYANVTSE